MAAGAECLARAAGPAAESKPMHVVVTLLIHFPDLDESPAPLATPEEEEAPVLAMEVPDIKIQPPASGEQRPSVPKKHPTRSRAHPSSYGEA